MSYQTIFWLGLFSLLSLSCANQSPHQTVSGKLPELKLIRALPVEGMERIEPSGLVWYDSTLYSISDKHDNYLYHVLIADDRVRMEPHFKLDPARLNPDDRLDFEGITADESGNFYIISETHFRIIRVSRDGTEITWFSPSFEALGQEKGLFQKHNAYFEGITYLGDQTFLMCAERQARGLIEFNANKALDSAHVVNGNATRLSINTERVPDFSGLHAENGTVYVLYRAANAVCRIEYDAETITEKECYSYQSTENDPAYAYTDMTYGLAEGLTMTADRIYIILDKNKDHRRNDSRDERPQLFIFERPDDF